MATSVLRWEARAIRLGREERSVDRNEAREARMERSDPVSGGLRRFAREGFSGD